MSIQALVFEESIVGHARDLIGSLPNEWYRAQGARMLDERAACVVHDDVAFVLSTGARDGSRKLVVALDESDLGPQVSGPAGIHLLDRCLRFALHVFEPTIKLPPSWKPFHHQSFVSFFAFPLGLGSGRLVAEVHPLSSGDVFVADLSTDDESIALETYAPRRGPYTRASKLFATAIAEAAALARAQGASARPPHEIDLESQPDRAFGLGLGYEEWLHQLSQEQLRFVNHPLGGPVKLRGAAGTGKTIAMVVKALKTLYEATDAASPRRILFLTHSWAAAEVVDRAMTSIDTRQLYRAPSRADVTLELMPLLTLVEDELKYRDDGIQPLGSDSHEGKVLQLKEIRAVLDEFRKGDWLAYRSACSEPFRIRIEAATGSRPEALLAWDLMNEFACVLGAQRVRPGDLRGTEQYLTGKRPSYALPLAQAERKVVLRLYDLFLDRLRSARVMTSDQMVNDYLGRLATFYWENVRIEKGCDVLFVDEMHLFNEQERLVFHQLIKKEAEDPSVIMALDPKQSPRDTFLEFPSEGPRGAGADIFAKAQLGRPTDMELTQVYRYSPEIVRVVQRLDRRFPTLDLGERDWRISNLDSKAKAGQVPRALLADSARTELELAIEIASEAGRGRQLRRSNVAILCLDHERFESYLRAQWLQDKVVAIRSREDTEKLRYFSKRLVLSQPEYVAGLQFDTVLLMDANRELSGASEDSGYSFRRFLSELYLGLTRAERAVSFFATEDRGGFATIVQWLIADGVVQPIERAHSGVKTR